MWEPAHTGAKVTVTARLSPGSTAKFVGSALNALAESAGTTSVTTSDESPVLTTCTTSSPDSKTASVSKDALPTAKVRTGPASATP